MRACVIGRGVGLEHIKGYEVAGVPVVANPDRMEPEEIRAGDYEILSIASPDQCHVNQAIAALRQGIHVFCEKPASHNKKELDRLDRAVRESRATFEMNLPLIYHPVFVELIAAMRRERPYFVEGSYNWGRREKMLSGWRAECQPYSFMAAGGLHLMGVVELGLISFDPFSGGPIMNNRWVNCGFWRTDEIETASWEVGGVTVQITANFGYNGIHEQIMKAWFPSGCMEARNRDQVCKWPAIPGFVETVRKQLPGYGRLPLYLNRVALG